MLSTQTIVPLHPLPLDLIPPSRHHFVFCPPDCKTTIYDQCLFVYSHNIMVVHYYIYLDANYLCTTLTPKEYIKASFHKLKSGLEVQNHSKVHLYNSQGGSRTK